MDAFLASCEVMPLLPAIRAAYVDLRRRYRLKLGDAVVAATAIALGQPLMTADKGFQKVTELQLTMYEP